MWKRTHNDRTRGLLLTGLKAAGSAAVAIAVASAIHLQFSATAGIIAILSLMGTKRETMKVALGRLMAYGSALLIAFVCFSLFGDGLLAFGIYLFVFAALCYACSWGYATAMISVLISHFMGTGRHDVDADWQRKLVVPHRHNLRHPDEPAPAPGRKAPGRIASSGG